MSLPEHIFVNDVPRPTTNSRGQPIHATLEGIENFWKWFEGSKCIDDEGRPLVAYHGTYNGEFDVFDRLWSAGVRGPSMDTVGIWFSNNPGDGGAHMYAQGAGAAIYPVYLKASRIRYYDRFEEFLREMHEAEGRRFEEQETKGIGSTEGLRRKLKEDGYDGIGFIGNNVSGLFAEVSELNEAIARTKQACKEEADRLQTMGLDMSFKDAEPFQAKIDRLTERRQIVQAEIDYFGRSTEFDNQIGLVVLDPHQIKSAIGNSGAFDPNSPLLTDNPCRPLQDQYGLYRQVMGIKDLCGNWKRLQSADDEEYLALYHATSPEAAIAITRDGYASPKAIWDDSKAGYVYMGAQNGLGTYGGAAANGRPHALVCIAVKKRDIEPDIGGDWKSYLRHGARTRREVTDLFGPEALTKPSAIATFATINQVRARTENTRILGAFMPDGSFVCANPARPASGAAARRQDRQEEPSP